MLLMLPLLLLLQKQGADAGRMRSLLGESNFETDRMVVGVEERVKASRLKRVLHFRRTRDFRQFLEVNVVS